MGCVSLEPWDDTWRRNQHLAARLVRLGLARGVVFVEPPLPGRGAVRQVGPPGVEVVRPPLVVPKRLGGLRVAGRALQRGPLASVDVVWVNDATLGVHTLRRDVPAVHDVTDDWRAFDSPARIRARTVAAEDVLARRARTVVCSEVLAERWEQRYGVRPAVVRNGVDLEAVREAQPVTLDGPGPHVGYVGTLHPQRLDVELVVELAARSSGTVHLVGPVDLPDQVRSRLTSTPRLRVEGPVPSAQVPAWITAMDVLVCPHLVNDFTMSLDAIKAHEYLATTRPVVATATSGFQSLAAPGLQVVGREQFCAAVLAVEGASPVHRDVADWDVRAREFARELTAVLT